MVYIISQTTPDHCPGTRPCAFAIVDIEWVIVTVPLAELFAAHVTGNAVPVLGAGVVIETSLC